MTLPITGGSQRVDRGSGVGGTPEERPTVNGQVTITITITVKCDPYRPVVTSYYKSPVGTRFLTLHHDDGSDTNNDGLGMMMVGLMTMTISMTTKMTNDHDNDNDDNIDQRIF